jgi:amino-acid N-acetyltransferase
MTRGPPVEAHPSDVASILALLEHNGLPRAAIERYVESTVVVRDGARVVGCAAIEPYGTVGLLRSVAVEPSHHGRGLGSRLTDAALALARRRGIRTLYLLTETAMPFFTRFGFTVVPRSAVAAPVRGSVEFTTACPASAVAMAREL